MTMIIEFSFIIITHAKWFPLIYGISAFGAIYISMIISALLCSRSNTIEITDGTILINQTNKIQIDSIDWFLHDKNYFFDGIRIRTKQNKNYFFTTINFANKDSNFNILKNILINKVGDKQIPIKTDADLIKDSKFLRYSSAFALIFLILLISLTLFTDYKMNAFKIIYVSMIIIGTFIATRK
jgi:hypothetical protein